MLFVSAASSAAGFQNFMEAVTESNRVYIFGNYPWRTLEILVPVLWSRGVEWITMGPTGNSGRPAIDLPIRLSFTLQRAKSLEEMKEDMIRAWQFRIRVCGDVLQARRNRARYPV
jgi:hypothetical protein